MTSTALAVGLLYIFLPGSIRFSTAVSTLFSVVTMSASFAERLPKCQTKKRPFCGHAPPKSSLMKTSERWTAITQTHCKRRASRSMAGKHAISRIFAPPHPPGSSGLLPPSALPSLQVGIICPDSALVRGRYTDK